MSLLTDIRNHLITNSIVEGVTGWTCYISYLPPDPDQAITIMDLGSEEPDNTENTKYDMTMARILIRAPKLEYDTAQTQFESIFDTLHDATISGYIFVYALNATPIVIGYDQNERPVISLEIKAFKTRS